MTTNKPCLPSDHIPDITGMCRVCGEECFRPCPAEETIWNSDVPIEVSCGLYAGHEGDHDFGEDEQ